MENVDFIRRQDFEKGSIFPGYVWALSYNTVKSDTALMHEACELPLSDEEKQKWIQIVAHSVLYHCMILQQLDSVGYPIQCLAQPRTGMDLLGIVCHESNIKCYKYLKKNFSDWISIHPGCCEIHKLVLVQSVAFKSHISKLNIIHLSAIKVSHGLNILNAIHLFLEEPRVCKRTYLNK